MSKHKINVAVGVLCQVNGEVLFTQRPTGKPMAGYWEFPGGKLELGESAHEALARELYEEIGVCIIESTHWRVVEHVYPHAHVLLHFRIVTHWSGEPHGRETQDLRWQKLLVANDGQVLTPRIEPILPATIPILADLAQYIQNHIEPKLCNSLPKR